MRGRLQYDVPPCALRYGRYTGAEGGPAIALTPPPLPLLHTVAAATAATVDPAVLLPALVVFAVVLIWLCSPRMTSSRFTRATALRLTMSSLVFFAVLPSVVPYDHLLPGGHVDNPAEDAIHAQHCHGSPASCADAPIAAGPGQLIFSDPLVVAPALFTVLIALTTPALSGISIRPPTRPPRTSLATI